MKARPIKSERSQRSEFFDALRKGMLLGLAGLALALPPSRWGGGERPPEVVHQVSAPSESVATSNNALPHVAKESAPEIFLSRQILPPALPPAPPVVPLPPPKLAAFGSEPASSEVRHVANWAFYSDDNRGRSVVVVDKRNAKVFVFDSDGKLIAATAALLGSAIGDHTVPGVGDKPLSQVTPEERTTPAGRFIAEPGMNTNGEDVIWVDYDAAVSMHRVRPHVRAERRLERLASPTPDDNRISYGCINLPVTFYERVLSPTVRNTGAVIYVLPEVEPIQAIFGSFDVPPSALLAQR
jgi:hypothetical protein